MSTKKEKCCDNGGREWYVHADGCPMTPPETPAEAILRTCHSQSESEWEYFEERFKALGYASDIKPLKDYISKVIATAVAKREKELVEEVEKIPWHEDFSSGLRETYLDRNKVLSLLKHL